MVERARPGELVPGVLVVDGDAEKRRRVATLLGEAGIPVIAVADSASALAAMSLCRFELAVADGLDVAARLRAAGLAVMPADHGEPRRFVGRVRDRLLGAAGDGDADVAERYIAVAKVACLGQRQHAARDAGAAELVAALAREIVETRALGRLAQ